MNSSIMVTSTVRGARGSRASGFVRVASLERGCILAEAAIPESTYRDLDDNPRGGLRGARGISSYGERIVLANTERVLVLGPDWCVIETLAHPLMAGIHDILATETAIWVTSTAADLLLKVGWNGEIQWIWEWRRDPQLRAMLGLDCVPPVDRGLDYRDPRVARNAIGNTVHLNSVAQSPGGLLLSFGRVLSPKAYRQRRLRAAIRKTSASLAAELVMRRLAWHRGRPQGKPDHTGRVPGSSYALVRLDPRGRAEIVHRREDTAVPNHNIWEGEGWLVYNDTNAGELVGVAGTHVRRVAIPGQPGFVRGLQHLRKLEFLVGGQNPAAVYHVDLEARAIRSVLELGGVTNEAVYDICRVPATFATDPRLDLGAMPESTPKAFVPYESGPTG